MVKNVRVRMDYKKKKRVFIPSAYDGTSEKLGVNSNITNNFSEKISQTNVISTG